MNSRGGSQNNSRPQTSSSRGRGTTTQKKRGGSNNVSDYDERGRGRGESSSRGRPYKRESMVAKPTVLIKGTPTILGAKQLQQQEPDQQQQQINNSQPIIILSPNNTSAPATSPINTDMMVKKSPQLVTRVLQQQEGNSTPKSPIQPVSVLNKAPSPTPQKVVQPNKCYKLMSENLEVLTEQISKILSSTVSAEQQTSDFTVIGVLGEQGVGKSTILNELARRKGKMEDVFPIQSMETQLDARHETIGLDLYVIPEERLILIDSQPLFSASMLMALIQRGDHYSNISTITQNKLSPDILSIENYVDLVAVQLGLLLFSICHTVLVVMDDDIGDGLGGDADGMVTMNRDLKMLRFVQTMRMLQKGIPNSLVEENTEYIPDVVFVYNRVNSRTIESDFCVKQVERFLDSYMTNTTIRKNGLINPSIDCALSKSSNRVNLFLLPDSDDIHNYSVLIRTLRNALLNMPKTSLARTVSERDWLLNTARIWELIRKSPFIAEFNRSYQKLALYKIP